MARAVGDLDALVAISQMTVSQMDALSTSESHHQRLHWLSEQVPNWSGLPVVHVRPTVFLDTGLFTTLAARSIADNDTIRLPFGTGRTSPIASDDVARVVATVLTDPVPYIGRALQLTGPRSQDMNGVAAHVFILTGGGPGSSTQLLSLYLYRIEFKFFDDGQAAALAVTVLVVVSILYSLVTRLLPVEKD